MAAAKWTTRETLINSRAESILAYLSRCGSRSPLPPHLLFFALVTVRQHRDEPKKEEGREEGKKRRR